MMGKKTQTSNKQQVINNKSKTMTIKKDKTGKYGKRVLRVG
jgi:hypothetical protein